MSDSVERRVLRELERLGIEHEVVACDPEHADTDVFCERHGHPVERAANAIVVATKKEPRRFACCVVKGTRRLDVNRKVRDLLGGRASFARPDEMRELTGMEVGGVTPFGLPESLPLYLDEALLSEPYVICGTGGRTSKVLLAPAELARLPGAQVVPGLSSPKE